MPIVLFFLSVAVLPGASACASGALDKAQIARGRLCFDEPVVGLSLEVAPSLLDETAEAPPLLGWLLAEGAARMLRRSEVFAEVGAPGEPLLGRPRRVVRLEGGVTGWAYFQDYRWFLLYAAIVAVPGGSVAAPAVLIFGGPIYSDRGEIAVELRVRDVPTGAILGRYRGATEDFFHHSLYNFDEFADSFWGRPELLFRLALQEALERLVADRRAYRRLAARGPG